MGLLGDVAAVGNLIMGVDAYDYQKRMQREAWGREDTAMQRRVADLRAAGLSPVLAAGQGATSSPPISIAPPHLSETIGSGPATALALMQSKEQVGKTAAESKLVDAQIAKVADERAKIKADAYQSAIQGQAQALDLEIQKKTGGRSHPSPYGSLFQDIFGVGKKANDSISENVRENIKSKLKESGRSEVAPNGTKYKSYDIENMID